MWVTDLSDLGRWTSSPPTRSPRWAASTCWSTTRESPSAATSPRSTPTSSRPSPRSTTCRRSVSPWRSSRRCSSGAQAASINVASVAATLSSPGEAAYSASKAALAVFSESMAVDLWGTGVRTLAVYPGIVDTELFSIPDNDPLDVPVEPITVDEAVADILAALERDADRGVRPRALQAVRGRQGERRRGVPRRVGRVRPPAARSCRLTAHATEGGQRASPALRRRSRRPGPCRPTTTRSSPRWRGRRWTCVDLPDPGFLLPDWVVTRPLLTGICGSDAKQVFMDWGESSGDNPMMDFTTFPQVLGHEVVAEVVALGPEAEGVDDRRPGRAQPVALVRAAGRVTGVPGVRGGRPQPVLELPGAADRARHPHRHVEGRHRRVGHAHARAPVDAVPGAPTASPTRSRCSPTRSRCRSTRSPVTRRSRAAKCWCTARARSARARSRSCARSTPTSRSASSRASTRRPTWHASSARTRCSRHAPAEQLVEEAAEWSGGRLASHHGLPMAFPGAIDVVYDTISKRETLEVSRAAAQGARHPREGRRPRHHELGVHAAVLQGDQLGRLERVRVEEVDGVRKHGIEHYLDLVRVGAGRPHRDAHAHVPARRLVRRVHRARHPGRIRARSRSPSTSAA